MISRRHFFVSGTCAICSMAAFRGFAKEPGVTCVEAEGFFLCSTPPITSSLNISELSNRSDAKDILEYRNGPNGEPDIDLYATARNAFRWKKSDSVASSSGRIAISVGFLDGNSWQQEAVKKYAPEWTRLGAAIEVVFTDKNPLIRISFTEKNHSSTGRNALGVSKHEPTMHLLNVSTADHPLVVQRVIMHEFGHGLLTMGHEQKHPDAGFAWNESEIVKDTGWSLSAVRENITSVYGKDSVCRASAGYDPDSIMHYPIKANWNKAGRVVQYNTIPSAGDIECARSIYS